jgi:hypothetical protein
MTRAGTGGPEVTAISDAAFAARICRQARPNPAFLDNFPPSGKTGNF